MTTDKYDHQVIEAKWSRLWEQNKTYATDLAGAKRPYYNLMMFPYPSAEGLHVGNVFAFVGSDIHGRFMRAQGYDVFEPMGFDAFGIHSENYAITVRSHPVKLVPSNIENFRENQLKRIGAMFDWSHQVDTTNPDYYRWTQWIFVQLYKAGLAYQKDAPVNWCPSCKTVLSNEQAEGGLCERCGSMVEQRKMHQWFFRTTAYAQKLLENLDWIDWSNATKTAQRRWIGRSEGAEVEFKLVNPVGGEPQSLRVFTTRPDTLFGATYMVLAPEHPLVEIICTDEQRQTVKDYCREAAQKAELIRTDLAKEKTGVFTGAYAVNPVNGEQIPIWVADYVLISYGSGAIMAVPAHDSRDFEFAKQFDLPIRAVVMPPTAWLHEQIVRGLLDEDYAKKHGQSDLLENLLRSAGLAAGIVAGITFQNPHAVLDGDASWIQQVAIPLYKNDPGLFADAYTEDGTAINSGEFDGQETAEFKKNITAWLNGQNLGQATVNYRLRDWCISRQRYWGPPIPIVHCDNCGVVPVPEEELPVLLPFIEDFVPDGSGKSPLARDETFVNTTCPKCKGPAKRETDVNDNFLDSAWYFFRYPSSDRADVPFDAALTRKWLPVDMYIGGQEHAVLHLMYTRFLTMALKDIGLIDFEEPFKCFRAHGLIVKDGAKMSKSKGNVVNPDEYIKRYGADTFRTYLMFLGPYQEGGDFRDTDIIGIRRFLERLWRYATQTQFLDEEMADRPLLQLVHSKVKKVTKDVKSLRYNTAIAASMELLNGLQAQKKHYCQAIKILLQLICPFAPFIAHQLWERLGGKGLVNDAPWPEFDENLSRASQMELAVQVNGKLIDRLTVEADADDSTISEAAKALPKVAQRIGGKQIAKLIIARPRVVNIVMKK
ncbi:MAG: leucine--tRNA ligase [Actinobacteria bacterium]|nr:leucine--tRNA ligase [Actinomycetota bacterium]